MKKIDILFVDWGLSKNKIENALTEELAIEILNFSSSMRNEVMSNSKLSEKIKDVLNSGKLLDEITIGKFLSKILNEKSGNLILAGYPRIVEQYSQLQELLIKENLELNKIWFFKLRNQKEFMEHHFEVPINKKYLEKYGNEVIDNWVSRFEEKRKNIDKIKVIADSVDWKTIEIDYETDSSTENIRERIKDCA